MAGVFLPELGPRRVLIESADTAASERAGRRLREAGFEVELCDGRGPGGRGCPLLRGERCLLLERAGVVLHALPRGDAAIAREARRRRGAAVVGKVPAGELGGRALEAARLLRSRQARGVRRGFSTPDGRRLLLRPVRRSDAGRLRRFDGGLGERTRRLRYLSYMPPADAAWAARMATADFHSRFAVVALDEDSGEVVGDARLLPVAGAPGRWDLGLVVADAAQSGGLGGELLGILLAIAGERGMEEVVAETRYDNLPMIRLLRRFGFEKREWALGVITYSLRPASI